MATLTAAQLKTEITTNPNNLADGQGRTLQQLATLGAVDNIAAVLNDRTTHQGDAAYFVWRNDVQIQELVNNIDSTNFASLTALQVAKIQLLFTGTTTLDASSTNTLTNLVTLGKNLRLAGYGPRVLKRLINVRQLQRPHAGHTDYLVFLRRNVHADQRRWLVRLTDFDRDAPEWRGGAVQTVRLDSPPITEG